VQNAEKIVKEAVRMGFKKIILPKKNADKLDDISKSIKLIGVKNLQEAINAYVADFTQL